MIRLLAAELLRQVITPNAFEQKMAQSPSSNCATKKRGLPG
jgi:hypothetical protein